MGKGIPEATGAILRQWQAQGLKFNWLGSPGGGHLGFDGEIEDYEIVEQPIPEGVTIEQAQTMWEQGLRLEFDWHGFNVVDDNFNWQGHYRGHELLAKLRVPFQPIPEKLLGEPEAKGDASNPVEWLPHSFTIKLKDVESDPNGLDPHAPGAKLDAGKNRLGLVLGGFARALGQVGLVGTGGAVTYSDNGWKEVDDGIARYEDAMLRHWVEIKKGNAQDPKTGLLHQAHLAWNALAVLELMLKETK